jgi:competence protein ComEC
MAPHQIFFAAASFAIGGIAAGSIAGQFASAPRALLFIVTASALAGVISRMRARVYAWCAAVMLAGALYAYGSARVNARALPPYGKLLIIEDVVVRVQNLPARQSLTLTNNITVYTDKYPAFAYGDRIKLKGTVEPPRSPLSAGSVAAFRTPIEKTGAGQGNALMARLIVFRQSFENSLKRLLSAEQAAFLIGITVGTTENFAKPFLEAMRKSGTTHLTALSGANITGIITGITALLGICMAPRHIFWPTVGIISLFVAMTGAESSLVRAALMNGAMAYAARKERISDPRNVIAGAALAMLLINPNLAVFDLGFQLSFAAIIGLTYIAPAIARRAPRAPKTLRECAAAQLATLPVLYMALGRATLMPIIPNMLIVPVIPATTALGFIAGGLGLIHPALGFAPAWLASVFVAYETGVIYLFARFG